MEKKEIEMLENAIHTHIRMLYNDAEAYKRMNNFEAQIDCIKEIKKYKQLKNKLDTIL